MPSNILYNFSAATATVNFDGFEVGELQSISVDESFDLRPLSEVGSSHVVAYIPGVFKGTLRAQRGILDMDRLVQNLVSSTDKSSIDGFINFVTASGDAELKRFTNVNDLVNFHIDSYNERIKSNKYSHVVSFNVEVKDVDEKTFMMLEGCVINTRKISLNVNNLLVLQDIELMYRKRLI